MKKYRYRLGQTIRYKGRIHRIIGVRFTADGVLYRLSGIREWVEGDAVDGNRKTQIRN